MLPVAERISLAQAATGQGVKSETVRLWCIKGVNGVCLRYERVGGRIYVSRAWIDEFLQALQGTQRTALRHGKDANDAASGGASA